MNKREAYTTFEAAILCHVSHHSIKNWIRQGLIKAIQTPGGHYRIKKEELNDFMRRYNMLEEEVAPAASIEPGRKVLVVDDDRETLNVIREILTSHQYEVTEVDNGFEAGMSAIKENPDLIILDFLMPRVDGYDVCQSLRKNPKTRKMKILALTSMTEESQIKRMFDCGVNDYLAKPFAIKDILERVNTLLRMKTP